MLRKLPTWTFLSKTRNFFCLLFLMFTRIYLGTLQQLQMYKIVRKIITTVFFITLQQCYIKKIKRLLEYNFYISNQDQAPALKVAFIFIFIFKCIAVISQHSPQTQCIPLVKNQSKFYEICSLVICISIKGAL